MTERSKCQFLPEVESVLTDDRRVDLKYQLWCTH